MEPLSLQRSPIQSNIPQPPIILSNMLLQATILLSMLLQEVIMPAMLVLGTTLPMAHMVLADTMPHTVLMVPTQCHMVLTLSHTEPTLRHIMLTLHRMAPTVETRTQPLQPLHMELQQQQSTKREFARMSVM